MPTAAEADAASLRDRKERRAVGIPAKKPISAVPLRGSISPVRMPFGLVAVSEESRFQLLRFRSLRKFGQSLQDLALGEINVPQSIIKHIVKAFSTMRSSVLIRYQLY